MEELEGVATSQRWGANLSSLGVVMVVLRWL